ncbi:SWIB/MDM2 domain-containing protein [Panaeolus papilionaceus]|nr:SWIB/MDM2 domain-containing protein [Panaeolus papilionaceus]
MAFDFAILEPRIHGILSAPGTDLSTISAKRVRRQLLELDSSLTPEFVKEHKGTIDTIIASVFAQVSAEQIANGGDADVKDEYEDDEDETQDSSSRKRKQDDDEDDDEASPPPKKSKKSAKKGQELSDAQLARKLSSEINGRSTRGVKGGRAAPAPKRSRAKKSAATVDSDEGSDDDGTSKRKKKSAGSGGAKGGFAKEFTLSEPLSAVLQVDKLSRPQVVKQLWVYIKGNELQNPLNKKEIMCDANLRAVFGVDKIDMFKMNKVLGQHLHEAE